MKTSIPSQAVPSLPDLISPVLPLERSESSGSTGTITWYPQGYSPAQAHGQVGGGIHTHVPLSHSLALDAQGQVWAWGLNSSGQLGDGTTINRLDPTLVSIPGNSEHNPVTMTVAGGVHSLALLADGSIFAWGQNKVGQLGDGTTTSSNTPVQVMGLPDPTENPVVKLATSRVHSLALLEDGSVYTWGDNREGQLGYERTENELIAVKVKDLPAPVIALSTGAFHSVALLEDGSVYAWGDNRLDQLGNGSGQDSSIPVEVTGLPTSPTVTHLVAGLTHTLVRLSDGTIRAWGWNGYGELGNGIVVYEMSPVPVVWGL